MIFAHGHLTAVARFHACLLLVGVTATPLAAESFTSGPVPVALIELYTSEGCSSCPPAERWLGALRDDPRLWREFVPVAFHVNYWDYIGWKDRLASPAFTDRQRAIARSWRGGSVYTPCFVRNGAEWRSRDLAAPEPRDAGELSVERMPDGSVRLEFRPVAGIAGAKFDGHVALLGGGIASDVRAGENAGRKLVHEFVALDMRTAPLESTDAGVVIALVPGPARSVPPTPRRALAAWVTRRNELAPLQATGGWLD